MLFGAVSRQRNRSGQGLKGKIGGEKWCGLQSRRDEASVRGRSQNGYLEVKDGQRKVISHGSTAFYF